MTGSKLIWEIPITSYICSTRPSRDSRKLLVGCCDVRMWDVDLDNFSINQANTMDIQGNIKMRGFIRFSHSGKMVITKFERSCGIEFLDTTTGEVIARMDFGDDNYYREIAFSPDEDQAVFWSTSLITVCDMMHPDNRVSFNPLPGKDVQILQVAFRTGSDLVICASYDDSDSALLQVWHRQDTGFECMYSLDIKFKEFLYPLLAPDGLTVVIMPWSPSAKCYPWSHNTAQFDPVDFEDQAYIHWPEYSYDGKLFACWSPTDSHVRVWDTRTGQVVGKFQTPWVDAMALSPTLIQHSPGNRLIALWCQSESGIRLFDIHTGHLYAQILGPACHMAFIQDTTKLACYFPRFGLRIWDTADLMDEHWQSTHGYEPVLQGMADGWVTGQDNEPLFWVPVEHGSNLCVLPSPRVVIGIPQWKAMSVDLSDSRLGSRWTECIDKEWLRELKKKEKEVGNVRLVLS